MSEIRRVSVYVYMGNYNPRPYSWLPHTVNNGRNSKRERETGGKEMNKMKTRKGKANLY
jgi:hypothetical protein